MPHAVVVVGPAGSGKSTVATAIATRISAAYLDKDRLFEPFVGALLVALGEDATSRELSTVYRSQVMDLEYSSLFTAAGGNLRNGVSVVIDAPFAGRLDDEGYLARMRRQAEWPPARVVVVVVRVPPDLARFRLAERGLQRDRDKLANWEEFWAEHGWPTCSWADADVVELANDSAVDLAKLETLLPSRSP